MEALGAALSAVAKALAKAASSWKMRLASNVDRLVRWAFKLVVAVGGVFLLIVVAFLLPIVIVIAGGGALVAAGSHGWCAVDSASASDPIDMGALEIATTIYRVGEDMGMGRREILTAYTVALVESGGGVTMKNVKGGDASSTGVFQQQNLREWTRGENGEPRNRNNVADAARTFFEHIDEYDTGQSVGELAADIQRPREDLRHKYADALPRAREFYTRVVAELESSGEDSEDLDSLTSGCSDAATSAADSASISGGARGIVEKAAVIADRYGTYVVSAHRPGDTLESGEFSDHAFNNADQAARDIAVEGVDAISGPPAPELDRAAVAIGEYFGRDYVLGEPILADTFHWDGFRIQIIWRTPQWGGHMGHIHIGARALAGGEAAA